MSDETQVPHILESQQTQVLGTFPTITDKYVPFEYNLSYDQEMERLSIINCLHSHDWLLMKAKMEGKLVEEVKYKLLLKSMGKSEQ